MLVSVFIPFCNEEKNLAEIIERTEKGGIAAGVDVELVMVDDGSTDGGAAVVEKAAETKPWVRLFRHRKNKGLTEAMNTGFKECRGEIIPTRISRRFSKLLSPVSILSAETGREGASSKFSSRKFTMKSADSFSEYL